MWVFTMMNGASVGANSGIVRRYDAEHFAWVFPLDASVGANSGIVRRQNLISRLESGGISFSRREFRNREAGILWIDVSPRTCCFSRREFRNREAENVPPTPALMPGLQSARIQES